MKMKMLLLLLLLLRLFVKKRKKDTEGRTDVTRKKESARVL